MIRPQAIMYIDLDSKGNYFIELSDAFEIIAYLIDEESSRINKVVAEKIEILRMQSSSNLRTLGADKRIACLCFIMFDNEERRKINFDRYTKLKLTGKSIDSINPDSKGERHSLSLNLPADFDYSPTNLLGYMDNNTFIARLKSFQDNVYSYELTLAQ